MKIAIIGGGASGMMCAIASKKNKTNEVFLIEQNEKLGKKIFITGKGRGNLTNACDKDTFFSNVVSNKKFLYSSFNQFSNEDLMTFFKNAGLDLNIERGNRVFPKSNKAYSITDCIKKLLYKNNIKIILDTKVLNIDILNDTLGKDNNTNENNRFILTLKNKNNKIYKMDFDKVVVATGGASYSSTGSTGDGYKFAKNLGINVTKIYPSLVPIEISFRNEYLKRAFKNADNLLLKNISMKISKANTNKILYEDFGEIEIMPYGFSGATILSASSFIYDKFDEGLTLHIDLKPALSIEKLDERILRDIKEFNNISFFYELKKLLPNDFIDIFIIKYLENLTIKNYEKSLGKQDNIKTQIENIKNKKISSLSKEERLTLINSLKNLEFNIKKSRSFNEAIITKGGIDIKEINPKTMESKKIKNLYFIGEVLDIDCLTGGFNMQVAFTTGYVAGNNLN